MDQSTSRIIRNKLGLLNLADELHNVSRACRLMGKLTLALKYARKLYLFPVLYMGKLTNSRGNVTSSARDSRRSVENP